MEAAVQGWMQRGIMGQMGQGLEPEGTEQM